MPGAQCTDHDTTRSSAHPSVVSVGRYYPRYNFIWVKYIVWSPRWFYCVLMKKKTQSPNKVTSILNNETVNTIRVLVKVPSAQTHKAAQRVHDGR